MNKKVLDKEGTAYLVEKIKENFVAKKDLEPINELPETGEPGRIYIIPEKKYINLEMVYANDYQQLIVVHDGSLNPEYLSENVPGAEYTGITNDAVKITVGGLLFSGAQGIGYEGDYEDQHGRTVHGEIYYCNTMESQEFRQIVIENGGTLMGLPVQAEIVEGLFIDDEGGVTPKYTASFNYGEDIINQSPITNNYIQYIYTEEGGWQELGANDVQHDTMPEPGADNVGQIIQYTGEDNEELEQGHFYICVEEAGSGIPVYHWEEINVQDTPGVPTITITLSQMISENECRLTSEQLAILNNENIGVLYCEGPELGMPKGILSKSLIYQDEVTGDDIVHISSIYPLEDTGVYTVGGKCDLTTGIGTLYMSALLALDNTRVYTPTGSYNPATKKYVDDTVASAMSAAIKREIVQQLPTENIKTDTIYMVPKSEPGTQNVYDEYMYINNAWEKIGDTEIDLSDYATKEYVEEHSITHYEEMPTPGADNVGEVIQYTGEDSGEFEKGHFYEVIETEASGVTIYEYKEIVLGDGACRLPATVLQIEAADDSATIIAKLGGAENAAAVLDAIENERMIIGLDDYSGLYGNIPVFVTSQIMNGVRHIFIECTTQSDLYRPVYTQKWLTYVNGTWACLSATNKELAYYEDATGYNTMPTADSTNFGQIVQYVGGTTSEYTTGHFYQSVSDGGNPPVYSWEEVKVQDSPSSDETVRQAEGWHLHQDIPNIHAFYEDAQWIIDQWVALGSEAYRVPNFSVDGYTLNRLALNSTSSTYDYREWYCTFGKVYNAAYYYYNVYFYTHYNYTTGTTSYLIYDETSNRKAIRNGYYTQTYLTSHQSLSNYLAKNNTTSFTPSGDYNPATKKYVDDTAAAKAQEAIEAASIQYDTLPEPTSSNVGDIYQYTGPDTQDLDHGHFYQVVQDAGSGIPVYSYQDIGITVGVTTAVVPQSITDITYGAYRRYPGYSDTGLQLLQNNNGTLIWGQTVNSIWIGTQEQYDALPEHFDTMIYFIKEDE